jgi:hypothetical protein
MQIRIEPRGTMEVRRGRRVRLVGGEALRLAQVRRWRVNCNVLATTFDDVLAQRLRALVGSKPW